MIRGCFYQLPSLGSLTYAPPRIAPIMLTRPGVYSARSRDPLRGSGSASKKTCVPQGSSDTDHSLELGNKNFNICTKTGCWSCGPWLTLIADSKSYQMWLPDICRCQNHRPVMIHILPNISGTFVDVWVIGCLGWFVDFC